MGLDCCGGTARPEHFHCHGCGSCCTDLVGRWRRGQTRLQPMPGLPVVRLPTPGGLRVFSWEATPFRDHALHPLLAVPDAVGERLVAVAYELEARRCPLYEDDQGCGIYDHRPLVCRAFPLLVTAGAEGPAVTVSRHCPSRVPVEGAAQVAPRVEPVLAGLYPDETAAALAVPAMMHYLRDVLAFLEAASVLEPVREADEALVARYREKGVVDLEALLEAEGIATGEALRARQADVRGRLRARWVGSGEG